MKILLVGSFRYPMYAMAFEKGFKALGHKVLTINTYSYRLNDSLIGRLFNRIMDKYNFGLPILSMNRKIIESCEKDKIDFVFLYYCCSIYPTTIKRVRNSGAKVFTYCNDDPFSKILKKPWNWKFYRSIKLADWNFVYRKKNITDYNSLGLSNVSVLLPYYLTEYNYPLNIEKDVPVAFMGHWESDDRDKFLKAIIDSNLPLTIYGDELIWSKSSIYSQLVNNHMLKKGQSGEKYNITINKFKIALVFFSKLNHDTYTRRCFEIPVTKTLMLCEYTDDMNALFPEDECAVYFRNEEELVDKVKYLLKNPEYIKKIANNGYNRLKEIGGSEKDRCKEVIDVFFKLK